VVGPSAAGLIGVQVAWLLIILVIGQFLFRAGGRRLVIQGG
jgi:ABC-2 type transport system permease protein